MRHDVLYNDGWYVTQDTVTGRRYPWWYVLPSDQSLYSDMVLCRDSIKSRHGNWHHFYGSLSAITAVSTSHCLIGGFAKDRVSDSLLLRPEIFAVPSACAVESMN